MEATFDPSRQLDLYFRVNRAGSKVFTFLKPSGLSHDVSGNQFEFVIKDYMGNSLVTTQPSVSGNLVTVSLTATQTNIPPSEYYWELNLTNLNRTWLNGRAFAINKNKE